MNQEIGLLNKDKIYMKSVFSKHILDNYEDVVKYFEKNYSKIFRLFLETPIASKVLITSSLIS